jgi:hypothetical protein
VKRVRNIQLQQHVELSAVLYLLLLSPLRTAGLYDHVFERLAFARRTKSQARAGFKTVVNAGL